MIPHPSGQSKAVLTSLTAWWLIYAHHICFTCQICIFHMFRVLHWKLVFFQGNTSENPTEQKERSWNHPQKPGNASYSLRFHFWSFSFLFSFMRSFPIFPFLFYATLGLCKNFGALLERHPLQKRYCHSRNDITKGQEEPIFAAFWGNFVSTFQPQLLSDDSRYCRSEKCSVRACNLQFTLHKIYALKSGNNVTTLVIWLNNTCITPLLIYDWSETISSGPAIKKLTKCVEAVRGMKKSKIQVLLTPETGSRLSWIQLHNPKFFFSQNTKKTLAEQYNEADWNKKNRKCTPTRSKVAWDGASTCPFVRNSENLQLRRLRIWLIFRHFSRTASPIELHLCPDLAKCAKVATFDNVCWGKKSNGSASIPKSRKFGQWEVFWNELFV